MEISGHQTFCGPDSSNCLEKGISQPGDAALKITYFLDGEFGSNARASACTSCPMLSSLPGYESDMTVMRVA